MKNNLISSLLGLVLGTACFYTHVQAQTAPVEFVSVIKGEKSYWSGYDPINVDGTYNVVIEIPAGTTAQYETNKRNGMLELVQKNGLPRYVQYLGYPVNYGAIPRSILLKSKGGNGDSVDALVLGPSIPRGNVVKGRIIGLLDLVDNGEKDTKAVIVMDDTPFAKVRSIADLDSKFPGITTIIQTWFTSYEGVGKDGKLQTTSHGFKGRAEAIRFVGDAILDFETAAVTDTDKRILDDKGNPYLYRWPGAKNLGE